MKKTTALFLSTFFTFSPLKTAADYYLGNANEISIASFDNYNTSLFEPDADALEITSIDKLTLDDKIRQMMIVPIDYALLHKNKSFGGVIYFKKNIAGKSSKDIIEINKKLSESKNPPFISIDQEGGNVDKLKHISDITSIINSDIKKFIIIYFSETKGFFPSQEAIAKKYTSIKNNEQRKEFLENYILYSAGIAETLHKLGFNMNFAPVLDVAKKNSVIEEEDRAYSNDFSTVSLLAEAYAKGFKVYSKNSKREVMLVAKHFPGLGDSFENTHNSSSVINSPKEELLKSVNIYKGLSEYLSGMMISHGTYTSIDNKSPATSSSKISSLIKNIGFKGLVISDDMNMAASKQRYIGTAINCDLLINTNIKEMNSLISYIRSVPESVINAHVKKILEYKKNIVYH